MKKLSVARNLAKVISMTPPLTTTNAEADFAELRRRLEDGLARLERESRFSTDAQRLRLRKSFEDAIKVLNPV